DRAQIPVLSAPVDGREGCGSRAERRLGAHSLWAASLTCCDGSCVPGLDAVDDSWGEHGPCPRAVCAFRACRVACVQAEYLELPTSRLTTSTPSPRPSGSGMARDYTAVMFSRLP